MNWFPILDLIFALKLFLILRLLCCLDMLGIRNRFIFKLSSSFSHLSLWKPGPRQWHGVISPRIENCNLLLQPFEDIGQWLNIFSQRKHQAWTVSWKIKESSILTLWGEYIFIHSTIIIEHQLQDYSIKDAKIICYWHGAKGTLTSYYSQNSIADKVSTPLY